MTNCHRSLIQPLLLLASLFFVAPVSAGLPHFFPNISSIPPSLIPNLTAGAWDAFHNFSGCHPGDHVSGLSKLKNYFRYFGYINGDNSMNFTDDFDDVLVSAVKTYQLNFNLNVTGVLDDTTIKQISMPRCGNADIINGTSSMNYGRAPSPNPNPSSTPTPIHLHAVAHYSFFPGSPRWPPSKTNLTYAFLPANQLTDPVKVVFATAFDRWSEVTPLTFVETAAFLSADIRIGFFSGDHGDGEPFDGVLGTLAHAFSPPSGHFHLDGDENWVVNGDFSAATSLLSAVDLESVAVHEIGHVLGLGHSSVEEAIMYPSISSMTRKVELAPDDIAGIQVLYGLNPGFNGSVAPPITQQRDTSGAHSVGPLMWLRFLLAVGLLSLIL